MSVAQYMNFVWVTWLFRRPYRTPHRSMRSLKSVLRRRYLGIAIGASAHILCSRPGCLISPLVGTVPTYGVCTLGVAIHPPVTDTCAIVRERSVRIESPLPAAGGAGISSSEQTKPWREQKSKPCEIKTIGTQGQEQCLGLYEREMKK